MNRSRRVELWLSGILLVVCLSFPDLLLRPFWKEPNLRLAGVSHARSVSAGELPPASSRRLHEWRGAKAAVSLTAATMSRLRLLAQAGWHFFESKQAERLAFIPPGAPRPQAIAPTQSKIITLEPLSYVEKADGRAEATISFGERVQVVHEGETFEVNLRVAKISSTIVQLVESSASAVEPHLLAEVGQGVAQAPGHKARQAPRGPTPEVVSNLGASRQSAPGSAAGSTAGVSEPSSGQELGYVERADGQVEAIVADGEDVRLAPATKSFANNFRAPTSTSANLEAANVLPPLINPLDSFGQESQPAQTNSSTREAGLPPQVASGPESSSAGKPQEIRGNNEVLESEQVGILQPEPLAEYSGDRLKPPKVAPAPHEGLADTSSSPPPAGSGQTLEDDALTPLSTKIEGTQPAFSILGYVEQPGGEKEAIVEVRGQVFLVHGGELSAEQHAALQGTASSATVQAVPIPPTPHVLQEILGLGAGGAIQGIFAVQVGAFRDLGNAQRLKERIESQFRPVVIQGFEGDDGLFYRVRVGNANTESAARELAERLRKANLATETFAVRLK